MPIPIPIYTCVHSIFESARKQKSVEEAQKKLHQQRRHSSNMVTLAQEIEPDHREQLHCQPTSMNHQLDSLTPSRRSLWLHQRPYILAMLETFGLSQAKTVPTPANHNVKFRQDDETSKLVDPTLYQPMVGSLLYAAIATHPDIPQAVGAASKYCSNPSEAHLTAVKRILRYLKETINLGLKYKKPESGTLVGYSDADFAGDLHDRRSTSGNLFLFARCPVSWYSKKQPAVSLSTAEAEYISLSGATQEAVWLRQLLSDFKLHQEAPTVIKEDNQGTIAIARNLVSYSRTKHIDIKYHYILETILDGCYFRILSN